MANSEANNIEGRQSRRLSEDEWRERIRDALKREGETSLNDIWKVLGGSYNALAKVVRNMLNESLVVQDHVGFYYLPGYKTPHPIQQQQAVIPSVLVNYYLNNGWKVDQLDAGNDRVLVEYTLPAWKVSEVDNFCLKCRTRNASHATVCIECGSNLKDETTLDSIQKQETTTT